MVTKQTVSHTNVQISKIQLNLIMNFPYHLSVINRAVHKTMHSVIFH